MLSLKRFLIPRSIGQRFAAAIGAGAGLILVVLAVANYLNARELLLQETSSEALKEVHDEMQTMDDLIDRIAMLPTIIGTTQAEGGRDVRVTVPWLASLLESCPIPAVYGLYMVYDAMDWRDPESDIWVDRKSWPHGARLQYDFHDPSQDWYHGARDKKGLHVTSPYFDEGGSDINMISITKPVYDKTGSFIGVAGVDLALDEMRKIVREMHIRDFGLDLLNDRGSVSAETTDLRQSSQSLKESSFLISSTGAFIVGPESKQPIAGGKPSSKDRKSPVPGLKEILASPSGWLRLRDGSNTVIYWAESRTTGWKLVLEVPYQLIVAPARTLAIHSALIGGAGLFLLLGVIFVVTRKVSGPIAELQNVASDFETGSYMEGKEVLLRIGNRPDELGRFANSFSAMAGEIILREKRLSEWNANLEQTIKSRTADLARAIVKVEQVNRVMSAELAEAAAYSRAVLPDRLKGPVWTDWVFVTSSQLGGDSFGYHWLDSDSMAIYLLDVCGHGVGAALLSVSLVNVLRNTSLTNTDFHDPSSVLGSLNATFPMERHNDMYFTAWYGVYTRSTGKLCYACGGHPPAVLLKPDGGAVKLRAKGPAVGAFPSVCFETESVMIPGGARLYLFSDGAYEIERPDAPMMSYEEFVSVLQTSQTSAGEERQLESIVAEIRRQQGSDDFADDLSIMELRFHDPTPLAMDRTLTIRNDIKELGRLLLFIREFSSSHGISAEDLTDLDVILEEIITNILKYGNLGPDEEACSIELSVTGSLLNIRITDQAIPFDPLHLPEVDTDKPIEERPIGGLGIHFVRKLTNSQHYAYENGTNILTLTKILRPPKEG